MAPSNPVLPRGSTIELLGDQGTARPREPLAGTIVSVILSLVALTTLSVFMSKSFILSTAFNHQALSLTVYEANRFTNVKVWRRVPFVQWLVFAIYVDSFLFVFATAILQHGFGVDFSFNVCEAAILLCLACYVTTKLIYLFLVEKAHIIRGTPKHRLKSKLYLFNSFGMIGLYVIIVVLNFIFRIVRMENGQCVIGMEQPVMIPLITFDLLCNVYLTVLFLIPLSGLYSFKHPKQKMPASIRLRSIARRTLIGSLCTLASSIVNLTVLMVLNGEQGWVCLICCNSDILFSAIMIHWVTSRDHIAAGSKLENSYQNNYARDEYDARRDTLGVAVRTEGNTGSKPTLDDDLLEISLDRMPSEDSHTDVGADGLYTTSTAELSGKTIESAEPLPTRPANVAILSSSSR